MKSYQFFTADGRGGTMLCDDDTLEAAVSELNRRFKNVVKVQIGKEVWEAPLSDQPPATAPGSDPGSTPDQAIPEASP